MGKVRESPSVGVEAGLAPADRMLWLEATEGKPELNRLWDFLRRYLSDLAGNRFSVEMRHFPVGAGGVRHPATRLASDAVALAAAQTAAGDADVLVYGCWAAPILETRSLVDVPVTGLAEASVRMGNFFGSRAAIVTVAEGLRSTFERDIAQFAARHALLDPPVWWLDPESTHEDVVEAIDRPGSLIDRFDAVAQRAVDAGADIILVGCGYLGPLFTVHGYAHVSGSPDVPVLDCCLLAYETAALILDTSQHGVSVSRRAYPPLGRAASEPLSDVLRRIRERRQ